MYIRLMENDREVLPLGYFEQRPMAGDTLVIQDQIYRVLDQPVQFERKTILAGTAVWGLTLQVRPVD